MSALGTQTLAEVAGLAAATGRLVRRRGPVLVGWFCAGWAVHQTGLFGSALLGVRHEILANLVFVLAVVAQLVALVLMVAAVRPLAAAPAPDGDPTRLPPALLTHERTIDVVTLAVGPFLAVYAVWGFIDDEVAALFRSNYVLQGLGGVQEWSISLDTARLPLYVGFAVAGWLLRAAVRLVLRRRASDLLAVVGLVAEGVWALSLFVVLVVLARAVKTWVRERVAYAELAVAGQAVLGLLPAITLPFGPTVREAATAVATQAPGVLATVVGLPLMWLALAAVVYGWRDVSAADVLVGTRAARGLERWSRLGRTPLGRVALLATDDLRTKYLPVLQALRLVGRAGPRVIGAYVLLATALQSLDRLLQIGLSLLAGPQTVARSLLLDPFTDLAVSLLVTVLSVALYGAVFARAVAPATGTPGGGCGGSSPLMTGAGAPASARPSPPAVPTGARPTRSAPRS